MFKMVSYGITNVVPPSVMVESECGNITYIEAANLETVNEQYCILNENFVVTCPKCHKSQSSPDNHIFRETEIPASNVRHLPECPVCHSLNVQKIGTVRKLTSFAVVGVFSSNIGKTMECKNCGYKF